MSWITVTVSVLLGLAINEMFDVSPWMARRVAVLAARVWTREPVLQATYAEEWQAIIAERPGKLSKLFTAAGFLGVGLAVRARTEVEDWAVLGWVSLSRSLIPGSTRRHSAPPRSVPRDRCARRVVRLRQALWTAKDTPAIVRAAARVATHTHRPRERGEALLVAALGLFNLGRDHELAPTLERARRTLQDAYNPRLAAHLDILSAMAAARCGQHDGSMAALSRAVPHLTAAEPTYEAAFAWHDLAAMCSYLGRHENAVAALQQAGVLSQELGIPDGHLANPGVHLRHALWYDHHGDTLACIRLLLSLVEDYHRYRAAGTLDRMRDTAIVSYGYAMARLAALDASPNGHAEGLLAAGKTSKSGYDMRTLGGACLAIAAGQPGVALASLDPSTCDSLTRLGPGEPHRIRAMALRAGGDLDAARVALQRCREAAVAERTAVQHAHMAIPGGPAPRRQTRGSMQPWTWLHPDGEAVAPHHPA